MVLQVLAETIKIDNRLDAKFFQISSIAQTRGLQTLRRMDSSGCNNHFLLRGHIAIRCAPHTNKIYTCSSFALEEDSGNGCVRQDLIVGSYYISIVTVDSRRGS